MNKSKKEPVINAEEISTAPEKDAPKSEVVILTEQVAELNDQLMRKAAEFDNFKKRTAKEKDELAAYAKGVCLKALLSVLDNFERALDAPCKDDDYKKGMEMIFRDFSKTIAEQDVTEIEALNAQFDPDLHNAINQIADENYGENTVCMVMQKGYKLGEKVLRHAMVVVANP